MASPCVGLGAAVAVVISGACGAALGPSGPCATTDASSGAGAAAMALLMGCAAGIILSGVVWVAVATGPETPVINESVITHEE